MCAQTRQALTALFMAVLLLATAPGALATVSDVTATPNKANIPINTLGSFTVTWRVTRTTTDTPPHTVFSSRGEFQLGGTVIGTFDRVLSKVSLVATDTLFFTETVSVPRSVAFQAAKLGAGSLRFVRAFDDSTIPTTLRGGSLALGVTGRGSGEFAITRITLKFVNEHEARVAVVPRGDRLRAVALINYSGAGPLTGEWQTANVESTIGEPIFVTRRRVRRYLASGRRTQLVSPDLLTNVAGNHQVRFVITKPELAFETPVLRYAVLPSAAEEVLPKTKIIVTMPPQATLLEKTTTFSWRQIPNVHSYQLRLCRPEVKGPAKPPDPDTAPYGGTDATPSEPCDEAVTGIYVPANTTETALPQHTLDHLEAGESYFWQVVGLRQDGVILGESDPRQIFRP